MSAAVRTNGEVRTGSTLDVPWTLIRPFADQPRHYFDEVALLELARSIRQVGQLQPALVCPISDPSHQFELIDGQRRWHAVQIAEIDTLRVEVREVSGPEEQFLLSFVANCGRANNTPMEYARGCGRLRENGATLQEIADTIGRSVGFVQQHLVFLDLHPDLQARLEPKVGKFEQMTKQMALLLAQFSHEEQLTLFKRVRGQTAAKSKLTIVQAMHSQTRKAGQARDESEPSSAGRKPNAQAMAGLGRSSRPSEILGVIRTAVGGLLTSIELWQARGDLDRLGEAARDALPTATELLKETRSLQRKLDAIVAEAERAFR
jgi:ParB family chromosome partitioning protein